MEEYKAERIVDSRCTLGEGPVWNEALQRIYWLDITGKQLHWYDPGSGIHQARPLALEIGCIVFQEDGGTLAAGAQGIHRLDPDSGELSPVADPEPHVSHARFNDGKCDPRGRFYVGTYCADHQPNGALYQMDRAGTLTRLVDGITISNGIAWSPDFQTMYYIDSATYAIDAFDYEADSGGIGNRRTLIRYDRKEACPDGMTSDEEGMLWVAEMGGGKVSRWNPHTGERLAVVHVPAEYVTSCVFGGGNREDLYITTARLDLPAARLRHQPDAGGLFRVATGIRGGPFLQERDGIGSLVWNTLLCNTIQKGI